MDVDMTETTDNAENTDTAANAYVEADADLEADADVKEDADVEASADAETNAEAAVNTAKAEKNDDRKAAGKELRRMNRRELIEIIYAMQNDRKTSDDEEELTFIDLIPTDEEVLAERARLEYRRRYRRTLRTTLYALIVVAAVAVLVATLFLPVLQVSGSSMEPTLEDQDIIVLVKTGSFETGDMVGFYYQNKLLLKRVIAGPGDVVDIDEEGNVYVNDELLDEPYVTEKSLGESDLTYPYQVPENRYFVMGDNRSTSIDSRSSTIGCIEVDQIVGKVFLRIWPIKRMTLF